MQWGINEADQRDIESFIEATPQGQALYEIFGYGLVTSVQVDTSHVGLEDGEWEKWKELERRHLPLGYTALWRPIGGVKDNEVFSRTWKERLGEWRPPRT